MNKKAETGVINIRGKEYKTVALRVNEFRADEQYKGFSLTTEIIEMDSLKVVMKAEVKDAESRTVANGFAEEFRANGNVNRTSALENCETSAIGRALAVLGLGGTEFASANEVQGAIAHQAAATPAQVAQVDSLLAAGTIKAGHLLATFGHSDPKRLLTIEADRIINAVSAAKTGE